MSFKPIPSNYTPPQNTFESFPDGEVQGFGIEWFSTDDQDRPILVVQKNGDRVCRYRVLMQDGTQGPPGSCGLRDVVMLVHAFGGDVKDLPTYPDESNAGAVSNYMSVAEGLTQSGKATRVVVKNGWVSYVEGSDLPVGMWNLKLVDISGTQESKLPMWREGQYGKYAYWIFEVISDASGDTTWTGTRISQTVPYVIEADHTKTPPELGWVCIKGTNNATKTSKSVSNLILAAASDFFENGWANVDNVLPEILQSAKRTNAVFSVLITPKQKGVGNTMNMATATAVTKPVKIEVAVPTRDEKARKVFIKMVNVIAGKNAFVTGYTLNPDGVAVAKEHLAPLKMAGVIPHGDIPKFTYENVEAMVKSLQGKEGMPDMTEFFDELMSIGSEDANTTGF